MNNKKTLAQQITIPLAALALVISAVGGVITAAHADTTTAATAQTTDQGGYGRPAAMGTVTAVSGNTITLTDSHSNTTYSVDASSATITKHATPTAGATPTAPTTITVSGIAVGDTLMVQGTVSGSNITATRIDDGQFGGPGGPGGGHGPDVHGTVTAVNGTTLTVTGSNGTTYTVDGAASTASKISTISVSDISVGDDVGIDGTVTGSTVTAKNIMDGVPANAGATNSSTGS